MSARESISASEANRSFPKLLRRAQLGQRTIITSHGRPVAELGPVPQDTEADRARRDRAWDAMRKAWAETEPRVIGPWTREELYERG